MLGLLLPLAGGVFYLWHKHNATKKPSVTPSSARVALHGNLLRYEHRPAALKRMARAFGAEGLNAMAASLDQKANDVAKQAAGAKQLVCCAREGDQNAMAMIACIREAADAGSPRALASAALIQDFIAKNPVPSQGE